MKEMVRKNGTFSLDGLIRGQENLVSPKKKPCPVCGVVLGHNNPECTLELYRFPIGEEMVLMWVCDCGHTDDCGFAYPDSFSEEDVRALALEREHYLNAMGFGINRDELEIIFGELNRKNMERTMFFLGNSER